MTCQISFFSTYCIPDIRCADFTTKPKVIVATGNLDKIIRLWRIDSTVPMISMIGHVSSVDVLHFSNESARLASASSAGNVKTWDFERGEEQSSWNGHVAVQCFAHSSSDPSLWALGCYDGAILLLDTRSAQGEVVRVQGGHQEAVNCLQFTPHGIWLASGGKDCAVKIWDIRKWTSLVSFDHHSAPVTALQLHPDELLLASGSEDRTVRLWDMETFECMGQTDLHGDSIRCMAFQNGGPLLYSATELGLCLVDCETRAFADQIDKGSLHSQWSNVQRIHCPQDDDNDVLALCFVKDTREMTLLQLKSNNAKEPSLSEAVGGGLAAKRPTTLNVLGELTKRTATSLTISETASDVPSSPTFCASPVGAPAAAFQPSRCLTRSPKTSSRKGSTASAKALAAEKRSPMATSKRCSTAIRSAIRKAAQSPCTEAPVESSGDKATTKIVHEARKRQLALQCFRVVKSSQSDVMAFVEDRAEIFELVAKLCKGKGIKCGVEELLRQQNAAVCKDLLSELNDSYTAWDLDMCSLILPSVADLLTSDFACYYQTAVDTLILVLQGFSEMFASNINLTYSNKDLTAEERVNKCRSCVEAFQFISTMLSTHEAVAKKVEQACGESWHTLNKLLSDSLIRWAQN